MVGLVKISVDREVLQGELSDDSELNFPLVGGTIPAQYSPPNSIV